MEVPTSELALEGGEPHPWRDGRNLFVLGCLEPFRITLLSQQVRALNLVYALACERKLGEGARLAVLGAGPAGMTAALAARRLGAQVSLYEEGSAPFATFRPSNTDTGQQRFVCPMLAEWPADEWLANDAQLPLANWSAGNSEQVAKELEEQFREIEGLKVEVGLDIAVVGRTWRIASWGRPWDWATGTAGGRRHDEQFYDALILAIGFGTDTQDGHDKLRYFNRGYWSGIDSGTLAASSPAVVSGDGDGALADVCTLALWCDQVPRPYEHALRALQEWQQDIKRNSNGQELLRLLVTFERRLLGRDPPVSRQEISDTYAAFEREDQFRGTLSQLDAALFGEVRDRRRPVTLVTRDRVPYKREAFGANRFLLWRLLAAGHVEHRWGEIRGPASDLKLGFGRAVSGVAREDAPFGDRADRLVVARHGVRRALTRHYAAVEEASQAVRARNELDLTREPAWPANFWSRAVRAHGAPTPVPSPDPPRVVELQTPRIEPILLDEARVHARVSLFGEPGQADWTRTHGSIHLQLGENPGGDRLLWLEHQLTGTAPFHLRVVLPDDARRSQKSGRHIVKYGLPARSGNKFQINLYGEPSGTTWMTDGVGFPVYPDMWVNRVQVELEFADGLLPLVGTTLGVRPLSSIMRRKDYDEIVPMSDSGTPLTLAGASVDGVYRVSAMWPGPIPPGVFLGLGWDRMVRTTSPTVP